jgi:hypothetical protein
MSHCLLYTQTRQNTADNPHGMYAYNWSEMRYIPLFTTDASNPFQHYYTAQQVIKSYLSTRTICTIMEHQYRTYGRRWERQLHTLVHQYYLDMCLEEELDFYRSLVALDHVHGHDLFDVLDGRRFYYQIPSYEFLQRYTHEISLIFLQWYVPLTEQLLELFPELLMCDCLDLRNGWYVYRDVHKIVRQHCIKHEYPASLYPTLIFEQTANLHAQTMVTTLYAWYRLPEHIIDKYAATYIDFEQLFEHYQTMPLSVLQKHFDPCRHSHYYLFGQRNCTPEFVQQLFANCPVRLNEMSLIQWLRDESVNIDAWGRLINPRFIKLLQTLRDLVHDLVVDVDSADESSSRSLYTFYLDFLDYAVELPQSIVDVLLQIAFARPYLDAERS